MRMHRLGLGIMICMLLCSAVPIIAQQYPWERLPPTPVLPDAEHSGAAPVNGIRLWYAVFGHGDPVILLHGGRANSNYWGQQIPVLARHYQIIVLDSRGHGRSTRTAAPIGYDAMASDVLALMDTLHIEKAALVGWSDGAIIGLDIAIHHPERLTKLFAFAANSDPSGVKDVSQSPTFNAYIARAEMEYEKLSSTPTQYASFLEQISKMWATQPHFTADQLRRISVPIWIVDGDHDEAIKRENTEFMAAQIPEAGLLLQPQVSHFSFIQDPTQFDNDVLHFLANVKGH